MNKKIVLTGIKPTGNPHLGNYVGAIKPALDMAKNENEQSLYFIADYHALNSIQDAKLFKQYTYEIAATWLSLGLDPEKVIFYRQSDVPEITELSWILSCVTPKGFMNRSHAYKSATAANVENGIDIDSGVNMGLFNYPILMAADILLFQTDIVPVGKDQIQHIEIAKDIAENFNRTFGTVFTLPEYKIGENTSVIPGLDGRKMSKSYQNTIPIFSDSKKLEKLINKITTDSSLPTEPKDPDTSSLFHLYQEFATVDEINEMKRRYQTGIGWGEVKKELFSVIDRTLSEPREKFEYYMSHTEEMDKILKNGTKKARTLAQMTLEKAKKSIGY